ncbi:MAG: hypothetical protein L0154_16810 [Chloroflexi bacterium]|nr:hypothetical protein [Chloroflexota bacterium]
MSDQTHEGCNGCTPVFIQIDTLIPQQSAGYCPVCGQQGKKVGGATVKTMVSISLHEVRDTQYYFCKTADCRVVYFNEDGDQTFNTTQVRERVYQKEPTSLDVLACYCFQHTAQSIRAELQSKGHSNVVDDINAGIQAGQCACDWRNPQGSCCLGNVKTLVKSIEDELAATKA